MNPESIEAVAVSFGATTWTNSYGLLMFNFPNKKDRDACLDCFTTMFEFRGMMSSYFTPYSWRGTSLAIHRLTVPISQPHIDGP